MNEQATKPTVREHDNGPTWRYCCCKHFRLVHAGPTRGGRILRRRECRRCGKRMTTWERATA